MFPKINPIQTQSWALLNDIFAQKDFDLRALFNENPNRFKDFSIENENFLFDFSKSLVDEETLETLFCLAEECKLDQAIKAMFSGEKINETENRAVLHTALRDFGDQEILVDGENIKPQIVAVRNQMKNFTEKVLSGDHLGFTGKAITDVVNIGIGGSDLGPQMVVDALKFYKTRLNVHFVSNVDGNHLAEVVKNLDPETTLFVIASKTFTTQETMTNAQSAKDWFLKSAKDSDVAQHFVALSTNHTAVMDFGISQENIFEFWDWVGGRFSMWSAIGLSISLAVGYDHFEQLLKGAHQMDTHFKETDFSKNIPVIMALLGIWYRNFFAATTYSISPYSQYLDRFPAYLQQTDMESNGKSVDRNGDFVEYETGPIIWGAAGTNGQHAFFQLIHQGTELVPVDFISFVRSCNPLTGHQEKLLANCLAQSQAMAFGKTNQEVLLDEDQIMNAKIEKTSAFKIFQGNTPTINLVFKELNPYNLGQLIALYEHKIFVQGVVWNVFSFDQFGVELGKKIASSILTELENQEVVSLQDSSTVGLMNFIKRNS
ncbi:MULTISPECIES: glucose-6-phosphate isomerase [Amniculibacterium]|uniref:glucose-6-phosphate isomerase n=1 Tax=Amniculibacterium TaxID=2715289 RepID=UPI000F5A50F7|nr:MULTISPECIES: glucose-6-phosphate isomerase [Amniculibacterium]